MRLAFCFAFLISSSLLADESLHPGPAFVFGTQVSVREKGATTAAVKFMLPIGAKVTIETATQEKVIQGARSDFWYQIKTADGRNGFVFGSLLTALGEELGDGRLLLVGWAENAKDSFEFRIVQKGSLVSSRAFALLGYSQDPAAANYCHTMELHRNLFGQGNHAISLLSFAGSEMDAGFSNGAYAFILRGNAIDLVSQGQGGADAPAYADYTYSFRPGIIEEKFEEVGDIQEGIEIGEGYTRQFKLVAGKIAASEKKIYKIRRPVPQ